MHPCLSTDINDFEEFLNSYGKLTLKENETADSHWTESFLRVTSEAIFHRHVIHQGQIMVPPGTEA